MHHETIYHILADGTPVKFTIKNKLINDELFYYSYVINTDLDSYKHKGENEKELMSVIEVTDGNQRTIYYKNSQLLIKDLIAKYGSEWLVTER